MSLPTKDVERLRLLLHVNDVPPHAQTRIINGILAKTPAARADARWEHLITPPRLIIRTLVNTRKHWRPSRTPTYEAYLTLVRRTLDLIIVDADVYPTPEAAAAKARETNADRERAGKRPMGTKDGAWYTWVPEHIRHATTLAFEAMYTSPEERALPVGRQVQPFMTLPQRAAMRDKWEGLLKQLEVHNPDAAKDPDEFAALAPLEQMHCRAAHAAKKTIKERMRTLAYDVPPPVHWVQVLDPDTRARLREAEKNL